VKSSCERGNEPSRSIKCWETSSVCTTTNLSSRAQFHKVPRAFGAWCGWDAFMPSVGGTRNSKVRISWSSEATLLISRTRFRDSCFQRNHVKTLLGLSRSTLIE
jgi:hypothetical protein